MGMSKNKKQRTLAGKIRSALTSTISVAQATTSLIWAVRRLASEVALTASVAAVLVTLI
ncbi:hypothetical protein UO65_0160 [Actinokineospora spheciospongiae]|uniref:Uncharacterized protein n=2 Tax=Actinokineospora spheciospongiae TaxID=909613 RepID=W7IW40_9PSEU|nr:hypothetical protein UO65_0160 [Actinokineospora spheciospongiae]